MPIQMIYLRSHDLKITCVLTTIIDKKHYYFSSFNILEAIDVMKT